MASYMCFRGMPAALRDQDNRFSRLPDEDDDGSWARVERKKRQRRSTGGTYQPSSVTDLSSRLLQSNLSLLTLTKSRPRYSSY